MLLNKSLYCMFPDPFLPRVAVTAVKGLATQHMVGRIGKESLLRRVNMLEQ